MLSKIFNSTRNIFNSVPQTETSIELSTENKTPKMVRTRAQRGKHAEEETSTEESIVVEFPRSLRKRSRNEEAIADSRSSDEDEDVTATPAKKQKILPLREKEDDGPNRNTMAVVKIPVSKVDMGLQFIDDNVLEDAEEKEEDSDAESIGGEDGEQREAANLIHLEISDSKSSDGSVVSKTVMKPSPAIASMKDSTASPKASGSSPISVERNHKHFGIEKLEAEPGISSTGAEMINSDDGSSDDEAPEVVGTQDAFKIAQSKTHYAAKAIKEQEAAMRKKRQERGAMLKRQAESAGKKRKAAEEVEETLSKIPEEISLEKDLDTTGGKDITFSFAERHVPKDPSPLEETTTRIPAISRSKLPDLLPEEYLQDDEESEELMDLDSEPRSDNPRKKKFTDLIEKIPKDRRKGSTTYRVSEARSKYLTPKAAFHARSVKESWLNGRAGVNGAGRKVASASFFKKK